MATTANTALSADGLVLNITGALDADTVPVISQNADQFIKTVAEPVFDLKGVTKAESSALALLTKWRRQAYECNKTARFLHVPDDLMAIARLSNVQGILGLEKTDDT